MSVQSGVLARLIFAVFLALWLVSVAPNAQALHTLTDEAATTEASVEHALWRFDHAMVDAFAAGTARVSVGLCQTATQSRIDDPIDPDLLDAGIPRATPAGDCGEEDALRVH